MYTLLTLKITEKLRKSRVDPDNVAMQPTISRQLSNCLLHGKDKEIWAVNNINKNQKDFQICSFWFRKYTYKRSSICISFYTLSRGDISR